MTATRAFAVYRRYYGFVRHALLRARVAEADVDDAVHEVFIVLLRKLGTDADGDDLRAWLFEVSRRIAANRRRAWRRHERKRRLSLPPPAAATPEDALARHEAAQRLAQFIASLAPDDRTVFRMAEIEGVPGRVVAERLGVQLHTAYRRMRSVRDRFEATFGVSSRRPSVLRGLFALPLRLAAPAWAPALAPAALGLALLPAPIVAAPVRSIPIVSIEAPAHAPPVVLDDEDEIVVFEEDEIEVLDERPRRRSVHRRGDAFASALAAALLPDGLVVRARPRPGASAPLVGVPEPKPVRPHATPGVWTGKFVDDAGQPLANARVFCRRRTALGGWRRCYARGAAVPRTDADGRVTIRFEPGTYELLPFADGELRSADASRWITID